MLNLGMNENQEALSAYTLTRSSGLSALTSVDQVLCLTTSSQSILRIELSVLRDSSGARLGLFQYSTRQPSDFFARERSELKLSDDRFIPNIQSAWSFSKNG